LEPEDSYTSILDSLPENTLRSRLRVMSAIPRHYRADGLAELVIPFDRIRWTKAGPSVPVPDDPEFLQAAPHTSQLPNLLVAYLSGLQAMAEEEGVPVAHGILPALAETIFPRSPVHVIALGRSLDPELPTIGVLSRNLIDVQYTNGRVFLSGRRPYVSPRILSVRGDTEPYQLTRIE
jgi:hypothetical protein